MNELNSHFKGEITEQQVAIEFLTLGYLVSKPLVQRSRYDFVVDINHKLYKIQVKTVAHLFGDAIKKIFANESISQLF